MRRNPDLEAALAALDEVGIRDVVVARGARHLQVRWASNGQSRMVVVPCTASDLRSPLNTRREVRRQLRLDGLLPESNGGAPAPSKAPCWREQVETLSRRLSQIRVPNEKAAERAEIIVALRQLINPDGPMHEDGAVTRREEVTA